MSSWPGYRRFAVSGSCQAIIEYSSWGMGHEVIIVNRSHITRAVSPILSLTPRIDFDIPTKQGTLLASLEVRSFLLLFIGGLRLSIDRQVVYEEGRWKNARL